MFGSITDPARAVIVEAVGRARHERAGDVRAEHLLGAVLVAPSAEPLLGQLNLFGQEDAIMAEIRRARRRGGLSAIDADALTDLGIDLDQVVDRVETQLGAGALDDNGRAPRRTLRGPAVASSFKGVLQAAQRQAAARGDRDLTVEHIVLGLLAEPGVVADTLAVRGCTVATALAVLDRRTAAGGRS